MRQITFFRNIPKTLENPAEAPAIIYFYAGSFLFWSAKDFQPDACEIAHTNNCVVFNVSYRLA